VSGRVFANACKGLGFLCGFPSKEECDEYAASGDFDKAKFCKELERRALAFQVLKQCDFYFWSNENPFKVLDEAGSGKVSGEELRKVMCSLGNKMSDKEYDGMFELVGASNPGVGDVDYVDLYKKIQAIFESK